MGREQGTTDPGGTALCDFAGVGEAYQRCGKRLRLGRREYYVAVARKEVTESEGVTDH